MTLLPEAYRYMVLDLRRNAVLGAFALTQAVAGTITFVIYESETERATMPTILIALASLVWIVLGVQRAAATVAHERTQRTWDFQRMTPQSGWTLALGKLVGTALFPTVCAAFFLPWIGFGLTYVTPAYLHRLPDVLVAIAMAWLLVMAFALMTSSYLAGERRSPAAAIGIILGLMAISGLINPVMDAMDRITPFYGLPLTICKFLALSMLMFACWTLAAAAWRIGDDLLESPRIWRLPLFMAFLAFYIFGLPFPVFQNSGHDDLSISGAKALLTFGVASGFCYFAPLMSREGPDHWVDWLKHWRGAAQIHRTPVWVTAWVTLLVTAVILALVVAHPKIIPFMAAAMAFMARDFLILQLYRMTKLRTPEAWAVLTIALVYGLPGLVIAAIKCECTQYILPVDMTSVVSGSLQAGVLAAVFAAAVQKQLKGAQG